MGDKNSNAKGVSPHLIGVGVAMLSALAAEGKDFDRDELNAMLDKLAASPEPEVRSGRSAMCYSPASPRPEVFEYVCKKCGTHTVYPTNTLKMAYVLARYRDGVASLRALGLDIKLDESPLCQKCHSAKELDIPTRGRIVKNALKIMPFLIIILLFQIIVIQFVIIIIILMRRMSILAPCQNHALQILIN